MGGLLITKDLRLIKSILFSHLCLSLLLLPIFSIANASDTIDSQYRKKFYKEIKKEMLSNNLKKRTLISSLYAINQKIKDLRPQISKVTDETLSLQSQLKDLAQNIIQIEIKTQSSQEKLINNLRFRYKSKSPFLMQLFHSQSSHQLNKNLSFLKRISQRDFQLVTKFKEEIKKLNLSKEKLNRKISKLITLRNKLDTEEKALHQIQKEKVTLVSLLKKKQNTNLSKIGELRASLKKEYPKLETSFFEKKGKLSIPSMDESLISMGLYKTQLFNIT